jgi:hypothetical protein
MAFCSDCVISLFVIMLPFDANKMAHGHFQKLSGTLQIGNGSETNGERGLMRSYIICELVATD